MCDSSCTTQRLYSTPPQPLPPRHQLHALTTQYDRHHPKGCGIIIYISKQLKLASTHPIGNARVEIHSHYRQRIYETSAAGRSHESMPNRSLTRGIQKSPARYSGQGIDQRNYRARVTTPVREHGLYHTYTPFPVNMGKCSPLYFGPNDMTMNIIQHHHSSNNVNAASALGNAALVVCKAEYRSRPFVLIHKSLQHEISMLPPAAVPSPPAFHKRPTLICQSIIQCGRHHQTRAWRGEMSSLCCLDVEATNEGSRVTVVLGRLP